MDKTLPIGDIEIPIPGFGAMGMSHGLGSNLSLEEAEPVLLKVIELGCTFWDTAVSREDIFVYNGYGRLTLWSKGHLPSWCQREAPRGFHQETQPTRQVIRLVKEIPRVRRPITLTYVAHSGLELRFRLLWRRQGYQLSISHQGVHRRYYRETRLRA
jgi:hypothetical protein